MQSQPILQLQHNCLLSETHEHPELQIRARCYTKRNAPGSALLSNAFDHMLGHQGCESQVITYSLASTDTLVPSLKAKGSLGSTAMSVAAYPAARII